MSLPLRTWFGPGGHDVGFWRRSAAEQIRFFGELLQSR
jgi:hypothetical protein